MWKTIRDLLTESDNSTYCIAKIMAFVSFVSFLGYAGYGLYQTGHADLSGFANGVMQVMIGSGAIIAGKQITK